MFDEDYLNILEIDLQEVVDCLIALVFAKKNLRDSLVDSGTNEFDNEYTSEDSETSHEGTTRVSSILACCDDNRELLYQFKESRLNAFMSQKQNVVLLEYYLQKQKENFGAN